MTLKYWIGLYKRLKTEALCLDIEVTGGRDEFVSVVGIFKPKDGIVEADAYVRGQNLTQENLKTAFAGCKLLITFNGKSMDIPKINKEFPGAFPPKIPNFDIYFVAKELGLDTNLKVLEKTLEIERLHEFSERRHIAVKLWKKWEKYHDERALEMLIEYNKQDAVNLYPLAEKLVEIYEKSISD